MSKTTINGKRYNVIHVDSGDYCARIVNDVMITCSMQKEGKGIRCAHPKYTITDGMTGGERRRVLNSMPCSKNKLLYLNDEDMADYVVKRLTGVAS